MSVQVLPPSLWGRSCLASEVSLHAGAPSQPSLLSSELMLSCSKLLGPDPKPVKQHVASPQGTMRAQYRNGMMALLAGG